MLGFIIGKPTGGEGELPPLPLPLRLGLMMNIQNQSSKESLKVKFNYSICSELC